MSVLRLLATALLFAAACGCSKEQPPLLTIGDILVQHNLTADQFHWAARRLKLKPEAYYIVKDEDARRCATSLWTQADAENIHDAVEATCPPNLSPLYSEVAALEARVNRLEDQMKKRKNKAAKEDKP